MRSRAAPTGTTGSRRLRQLDDVSIEVPVAGGSSPGLRQRGVQHLGACRRGSLMRSIEVCDAERDLCAAGSTPILRLVEGEVHEGAIGPRDCSVSAGRPWIWTGVVVDVKVESEAR